MQIKGESDRRLIGEPFTRAIALYSEEVLASEPAQRRKQRGFEAYAQIKELFEESKLKFQVYITVRELPKCLDLWFCDYRIDIQCWDEDVEEQQFIEVVENAFLRLDYRNERRGQFSLECEFFKVVVECLRVRQVIDKSCSEFIRLYQQIYGPEVFVFTVLVFQRRRVELEPMVAALMVVSVINAGVGTSTVDIFFNKANTDKRKRLKAALKSQAREDELTQFRLHWERVSERDFLIYNFPADEGDERDRVVREMLKASEGLPSDGFIFANLCHLFSKEDYSVYFNPAEFQVCHFEAKREKEGRRVCVFHPVVEGGEEAILNLKDEQLAEFSRSMRGIVGLLNQNKFAQLLYQ